VSDTPTYLALDGQTDSVKKYRIRLSIVNPSTVRWLGTALDSQTDSVKKNRIRLSVVNPSTIAGSERRSTARQIQSKRTEFVCPSSTRSLSLARNGARQPDRFSQKEQNSSVRRQPVHCPLTHDARHTSSMTNEIVTLSISNLTNQR
jgi:hypothetical protein